AANVQRPPARAPRPRPRRPRSRLQTNPGTPEPALPARPTVRGRHDAPARRPAASHVSCRRATNHGAPAGTAGALAQGAGRGGGGSMRGYAPIRVENGVRSLRGHRRLRIAGSKTLNVRVRVGKT